MYFSNFITFISFYIKMPENHHLLIIKMILYMVFAWFFTPPLKWKVPLVALSPLNPLKSYCAPCERVPP